MTDTDPQRQRAIDTTGREAREAVSKVAGRLEPLRTRIAVIAHRAERRATASENKSLAEECATIRTEIASLRTDLIATLMDKPRKVLAHSRVTDIEKSLDNLEEALAVASHKVG